MASERLAAADLEGQDFIMREPGSATRAAAEACLAEQSAKPKIVMELGRNETVERTSRRA